MHELLFDSFTDMFHVYKILHNHIEQNRKRGVIQYSGFNIR